MQILADTNEVRGVGQLQSSKQHLGLKKKKKTSDISKKSKLHKTSRKEKKRKEWN